MTTKHGVLPYTIEVVEDDATLTAHAGLPLVLETLRALGLSDELNRSLSIRRRRSGATDAEKVEALVLLMAAGGECVGDIEVLRADQGRMRLVGGLPSEDVLLRFLYEFHDERLIEQAQQRRPAGQVAYIPEQSAPLLRLAGCNVAFVHAVAKQTRVTRATLDHDATIQESHKKQSLPHYKGGRGDQPSVIHWAEHDLVLADEYRDGNVPAAMSNLPLIQRGFGALPPTITERFFRADSACYEERILKWLAAPAREDGPQGRIGLSIRADMGEALRQVCAAVPEPSWQLYEERATETVMCADVEFTPGEWARSAPPLRYVVLRIRKRIEDRIAGADVGMLLRLSWLLESAGCKDLAEIAWQRCLDLFPVVDDDPHGSPADERERMVRHFHWERVLSWVNEPSPGRSDRIAWLADRLTRMLPHWDPRGFPEDLRTDLGHLLIDRGRAPEWAASILLQRLQGGSLGAWEAVFAWWPTGKPYRLMPDYTPCKAMVMDAPLPADAPEDFDEKLLACAAEVRAYEREQIKMHLTLSQAGKEVDLDAMNEDWMAFNLALRHPGLPIDRFEPVVTTSHLVERLLQLPLTQPRATRLMRRMLGHQELRHHPRLAEIAAASAPIGIEGLPPFEDFTIYVPERIELYRRLGGPAADDRLRAYLRQLFDAMRDEGQHFPWHWSCLPELVDDDLRRDMMRWASAAPLLITLDVHHSAPWLVDEPMVEAAARRHLTAGLRWDDFDMLERTDGRSLLAGFIEERARRTDVDEELWWLLRWLEKHEKPLRERMAIVLGQLQRRPPTQKLCELATRMLSTRTAWASYGASLFHAILRWGDRDPLGVVFFTVVGSPDRAALLQHVHLALATALLDLAGAAADAGDHDRLVALLTAVLNLDPPPPIVRKLHDLRRRSGLPARAEDRSDVGVKLFKSGEGRVATVSGLYEALRTLPPAQSPPPGA